jgi:hypothetical protein
LIQRSARHSFIASSGWFAVLLAVATAGAQPVTLTDEVVVRALADDANDRFEERDDHGMRHLAGLVKLAPDGRSLAYLEGVDDGTPKPPGQLVIVRFEPTGNGVKPVEFRPNVGPANGSDITLLLLCEPYSPDGKLFVSPDFAAQAISGNGIQRRPLLVCQVATGKVARTKIAVDLRYARIDYASKTLLDRDGQSHSLVTGRPGKKFGYTGHVAAANPAAPLVAFDTGVERTPGPYRVRVWNLRDDKLHAPLPHNERFKYSAYVLPAWTSDGAYVYFTDVLGDNFTYAPGEDRESVTRVWNAKTAQLVGAPLRWSNWRKPGPLPGTMIVSVLGNDDKNHVFLHDAATGNTADLPVGVLDAGGSRVAYLKRIDGKPHLCVATLTWGAAPRDGVVKPASRKTATNPSRSIR